MHFARAYPSSRNAWAPWFTRAASSIQQSTSPHELDPFTHSLRLVFQVGRIHPAQLLNGLPQTRSFAGPCRLGQFGGNAKLTIGLAFFDDLEFADLIFRNLNHQHDVALRPFV